MIRHQLVIVGGGLAGLRAAVEAKGAGIDVAILSQVHPGRSHSGAAQGGINAALANHPEGHDDTPEKHAFDTVKGSDYLADQDAVYPDDPGRPAGDLRDGALGLPVQPLRRRPHRPAARSAAPASRAPATAPTRPATTCCTPSSSRPTGARSRCTSSSSSPASSCVDGRLPRRGRLRHDPRRLRGLHRRRRDHRHRRRRPHLLEHHQRHHLHRLRGGHGLPRRRAAQGHGVHPVPPHRACYTTNILMTEGCRGEGGYLVNDLGERFMERYAPKVDGAGPARHHGALHPDRDPRGPRHRRQGLRLPRPAPPGRAEDRRAAARHPRPGHPLRGRRPGRRSRCRSCPASTTPWAASTPTSTASPRCPGSTPPASAPA